MIRTIQRWPTQYEREEYAARMRDRRWLGVAWVAVAVLCLVGMVVA